MRTTSCLLALTAFAVLAPPARALDEPEPRLTATVGLDITTAYYFRGLRQEDDGVIAQPYAELALALHRWEGGTLGFGLGLWNSIHGDTGTAADGSSTPNWYEADLYLGPTLELGRLTLGATYTWYASPSDAFDTIEELGFSASWDDSDRPLLGPIALRPRLHLAFELGDEAADGDDTGTYLELGIEPGIDFEDGALAGSTLRFPVTVGLSLDAYYDSADRSDTFGFAQAGAVLAVPLPLGEGWGAWTLSAGVHALFLGEAASDFNSGDEFEVIGTLGVSAAF